MLRTIGVLVAGTLLGFVVLSSLIWAGTALNLSQQARPYAYYLIVCLTGTAVGLLVGFLQKYKAGAVAATCLLGPSLLQYVNRFSRPATGLRLFILLIGTAMELSLAFAVAHKLAARRHATHPPD